MSTPDDRLTESIARLEAPAYLDPVRDELDRLRTEVTHWREMADNRLTERQWALRDHARAQAALEQAEARVDRLHGNLDMLRATLEEERAFLKQRSDALNRTGASNDQLRATLARVQRLIDSNVEEWEGMDVVVVADLRAALADQEPRP